MREHTVAITLFVAILAAAVAVSPASTNAAAAQQAVDQTRPADPDADIEIRLVAGTVRVIGWDRREVRIRGTLGRGSEGLVFDSDESDVVIEVQLPSRRERLEGGAEVYGSELEIRVPDRASVEIDADGASVEVLGIRGELTVYTLTGAVQIGAGPREIDIETASGEVRVETDSSTREITLLSGSGMVALSAEQAEVTVETVSGTIEAIGHDLRDSSFGSTAGSISFAGSLSTGHSYEFESFSGDIVLTLPGDVSATFEASTYAGTLSSDFGPEPERAAGRSLRKRLEFTLGSGSAEVSIDSHSGSIEIRRR